MSTPEERFESYMFSMPNPTNWEMPKEYTGPTIPLSDTDASLPDEATRDLILDHLGV